VAENADYAWIWRKNDGYHGLGRFASVAALRSLALQDRGAPEMLVAAMKPTGLGNPDAAREVLRRLYQTLRDRKYPYAPPAGYFGGEQRIRDPYAIHTGAGTCLDLALMFAAMCTAAGLRPFVAVLEDHRNRNGIRDGDDHAVVLVDLASAPPDRFSGPEAPVEPEEEAEDPKDKWGVRRLVPSAALAALTADGVAVDVVAACRGQGREFDEACERGENRIADRGYRSVHFVDIVPLHREEGEAPPPRDQDRPAIYPSLPPKPPFTVYPSRVRTEDRLRRATGTVVLHGESGTGKSMLAHRVAATVDHGSGWFLDASSEQTLTAALAKEEAYATGRPPEDADGPEQKVLRTSALRRLAGSQAPWAVVLDNADQGPDQLSSIPQPAAGLGQLLIITTTNPAWKEEGRQFIELEPLPAGDVVGALTPDAPLDALDGRPLLLNASQRLHEATGRWWWSAESALTIDAAGAPAAFWAAVDGELDRTPLARLLARAISWLPPVALPIPALAGLADDGLSGPDSVRSAIGLLGRLGLAEAEENTVSMHRLFRAAVREEALRRDQSGQITLVHRILTDEAIAQEMASAPDLGTATEMGNELLAWPDRDVAVTGLQALAELYERHETAQTSARWYGYVIDRAEWTPGTEPPEHLRLILVDSLRGMARGRMRGKSSVDEAIEWTREAERLCEGRQDEKYRLAASRAEAMRGLLLRQKAGSEPERGAALSLLRQAEVALRHSYESRAELVAAPENSPDVDRSRYNLAGLEIRLAQEDVPEAAAGHLTQAERHYTEILAIRRARYRTDELEEVVCCVNGEALAAYYRAVLLDGTWRDRIELLRLAAERAAEAAAIRQRLAGTIDDGNTAKSVALLAKIALARLAVLEQAGVDADRDEKTIQEYRGERTTLIGEGEQDRG
jgi:hypothetical protein